jgi:hypothetical protein
MLFEKAIRKRQSNLPSPGHREIDTHIISGAPLIQLEPELLTPFFVDELQGWPDKIEMLVHWRQVPLEQRNIMVQEVVDQVALAPNNFYGSDASDKPDLANLSQTQAIVLSYQNMMRLYRGRNEDVVHGTAGYNCQIHVPEDNHLYTQPYLFQTQALLQSRQYMDEGRWLVTAPKAGPVGEKLVPLLGYGCYAPTGCRLSDIQQVYASVTSSVQQTSLRLYKESLLRQEGIVSPQGGMADGWRYHFVDSQASTSLIADILNHKVQVQLTIGDVQKTYMSVAYKECSESEQNIYITLIERRDA